MVRDAREGTRLVGRAQSVAAKDWALQGRAEEVATLRLLLPRVAEGRIQIVFLEGEAGTGKSRLLAEFLPAAEELGFQVRLGHAHELERTRPFGALSAAMCCTPSMGDARRAEIARLLATGPASSGTRLTVAADAGLQFRIAEAFVELMQTEATEAPVTVVLEDLQWADPSTLLVLHTLSRRLAYLPVLVIATFRPALGASRHEQIVEAACREGARRLVLTPLDPEAVRRLVTDIVGAEPGASLLGAVAGAGGNPCLVIELLRAFHEMGAITVTGGRAEVGEVDLPPTARRTILHRFGFLPDEVIQALRIASVLGASFTLADLSTAMDLPAVRLAAVLDDAFRAGILRDMGSRLRFRHDLIQEVIYGDIPAGVRKGLHLEIGHKLAGAGAPAQRVATHLGLGAEPGDAAAVEWLHRVAREAAVTSPGVAADLLQRALKLAGPSNPIADTLEVERAASLMWSGQVREAEGVCRDVLGRSHDPAIDGTLAVCLLHCALIRGRAEEGLEGMEACLDSSTMAEPDLVQLRACVSAGRVLVGDLAGALELAEAARSGAQRLGDGFSRAIATGTAALVANLRGHFHEAVELCESAKHEADRDPDRHGHRFPVNHLLGLCLVDVDRFDSAESAIQAGRRISEKLGTGWNLPLHHMALMFHRYVSGEWDDAIVEFETSQELADEIGLRQGLVHAYSVRSLIALHRNDLLVAEAAVDAAEREFAETGAQPRADWMMWAKALLLESRGAMDQARDAIWLGWDACERAGTMSERPTLGPDVVRLALQAGDRPMAETVARDVEKVVSDSDIPTLRGAMLRCRGLVSGDPDVLVAAADAYRTGPRPLELALACEDAAAALGRTGEREQTRALLDEAIALYLELHAARDLARADATLRSFGFLRGRRGPRNRPATGWESLTETEHTVVNLVIEGLSNPEIAQRLFISPRTVQTHLKHVFVKLNLSSRTGLAAAAAVRRQR